MNYGDFKKGVLKVIDEYSSRGTVLAASKTADLKLRMSIAVNEILLDLSREVSPLADTHYIILNPIYNESGYDTSALKQHLPSATNCTIELTAARSYFYECQGPATVNIQEENPADTWTSLSTNVIGSSVTWLQEYKGNITAASSTTNIRLYFDGDYIYSYRNEKLYPYAFSTDTDVQQHRPYFVFNMPSNFLRLDNVYRREGTEWINYTQYFLVDGAKQLGINRYDTGEYMVNYYRLPTEITITGVDLVDDAQTIDCNDDALYAAMLGVASLLQNTENVTLAVLLNNQYEQQKTTFKMPDKFYPEIIVNATGW